nr:MAG TPA: hypothetical protein [Caudoviricetes sp.]
MKNERSFTSLLLFSSTHFLGSRFAITRPAGGF